jgi:hypothetical protein
VRLFFAIALLICWAAAASATPYWTAEDAERARQLSASLERPQLPPVPRGSSDPLDDFVAATWFIASMQVSDSASADYGGIREGEHLPDVIQTDNTSESIWMFTRYFELTGDSAILPHLNASWTYVNNYPAHSEEGGALPGTGYYRHYNCGWALRAGQKYEEVFSDTTHKAYVDSCARYLSDHNLNLAGSPFHVNVNPPVLAWAAGNLRSYGVAENNADWMMKGWTRGNRVKGWVETDPTILGVEEWAMSGGATMWGLLESYFDEFPDEEAAWVATYAAEMDTVADAGSWENAWQGWYALGEKRLEESTGDPIWGARHLALTDYLLAFDDTDNDGGIMANPADLDTEDQAWVTAYLGFMCLEPLILEATAAPGVVVAQPPGALLPNRPNPFRPATTIPFRLREPGHVALDIVGVRGERIARLVDGPLPAGSHAVRWHGRDDSRRAVAAGVYFYRLVSNGHRESRKMVLLK